MKKGSGPLISVLLWIGLICCFVLPVLLYADPSQHEASFYQKLKNKIIQCQLCPRYCTIAPRKRGYCRVRENRDGTLIAVSYGKPVTMHVDPIEKKPLFHFLPQTQAFSVATAGCNLNCKFCQNWEISQRAPEDFESTYMTPQELAQRAKASGAPTIAYTYTEPTIFYEYMLETAKEAKKLGLKNVMHSNGYINEAPLAELAQYLDAANIDLKGFSDDYYAKVCEGSLQPVLRSLKVLKKNGVHVEITNLILAGYNDDPAVLKKMCVWIKENLGCDTPLHFSRFFPMYKLLGLEPTPVSTLEQARSIAMDCGLRYVYIGNVPGHEAENTYCPKCKKVVIRRAGYMIEEIHLKDGCCVYCGQKIEGVWH